MATYVFDTAMEVNEGTYLDIDDQVACMRESHKTFGRVIETRNESYESR